MMSYAVQTPPRPLPGAYVQTPAANRTQAGPARPSFLRSASSSRQQYGSSNLAQSNVAQRGPKSQQLAQNAAKPTIEAASPIDRAARSINESLNQEAKFPELDSYVGRESRPLYLRIFENPQRLTDWAYRGCFLGVRHVEPGCAGAIPANEDVSHPQQDF